jgi:hypothetical protein
MAKYQTPVGGFDTWEQAAAACERCDLDPCTCIIYRGQQ